MEEGREAGSARDKSAGKKYEEGKLGRKEKT